jgi:hypothetical protein
MKKNEPSPEKVSFEIAAQQVSRANKTDRPATAYVLNGSAIALRGLLQHNLLPDEEQKLYLQFVLESLERVLNKKSPETPNRAFRWSSSNRPQTANMDINWVLFIMVGEQHDNIRGMNEGHKNPVELALRAVARKIGWEWRSLKKEVWLRNGGLKAWASYKQCSGHEAITLEQWLAILRETRSQALKKRQTKS